MKKIIVLTLGMTFIATAAFAAISGSSHDLSANATSKEICVYCHTPHGGGTQAPLWNRGAGTTASVTLYNSGTTTAATNAATVTGDVPLCLSCHDGATAFNAITNPTGDFTLASYGTATIAAGSLANLGVDLTNDHPVGMNYSLAVAQDGGGLNANPGLPYTDDVMWCSSCHDVHDDTIVPFLNTTMVGSALCLACHAK